MKQIISNSGTAGTGFIDPCNNNFNEIFQRPGSRMQHFLAKVNAPASILKDSTIRVALIGDSIAGGWALSDHWFFNQLPLIYPQATFEFKLVSFGGTGANFQIACVNEIVNWDPDLVLYMEYENNLVQFEYTRRTLIELTDKTNSDICLVPWTLRKGDMDYIAAKNHSAWIAGQSYSHIIALIQLCAEFNIEYINWHYDVIPGLWDGTYTSANFFDGAETIHVNDYFYEVANNSIKRHFARYSDTLDGNIFLNNYLLNSYAPQKTKQIALAEAITLPDLTKATKSGTWSVVSVNTDKSYEVLRSSTPTDYIERKFTGIGVELSYFGGHVGEIGILVDGVALSTLLKDYQTQFTAVGGGVLGSTNRPLKVIVNSNILTNAETERVFKITMTSATAYTLYDVTAGNTVVDTGSISSDKTVSYLGGSITIPAMYANIANFVPTIVSGTSWQFSLKKNWYDSVAVSADNLTHTVRIFGLERKEHTVRMTCNSGTISLDSLMELK